MTGFVKGGNPKAAIDCCIELNHWDKAIELATKYDHSKFVENAIAMYTKNLSQKGNPLHAIQVHCSGGQQLNAAKILKQLALQMASMKVCLVQRGNFTFFLCNMTRFEDNYEQYLVHIIQCN